MASEQWAVGVDLGGTKINVAHVNSHGEIIKKITLATHSESPAETVIEAIAHAVQQIISTESSPPLGVGVGMAGQIELSTGAVSFAPNLGWHNVPLQQDLKKKLNLPVIVINDVRAGTWAEWLFGAGRGCNDLLCLFLGTGIGGGVVSNGQMLIGANNSAGELGHVTVNMNGPLCRCGNHGCLEAYAGGWAIGNHAKKAVAEDRTAGAALLKLTEGNIEAITAKTVVAAADLGNPLAKQILSNACDAVVAGCVSYVNAFNPSRLILGGGLMAGVPHFLGKVQQGIAEKALPIARAQVQVLPAQLHNDAGAIGAAAVALHNFK